MGVIEQVSRYDEPVNAARFATMQHFVERAERSIRRLQRDGLADTKLDPTIAADALGAMVARFAEIWLVQGYREYDFDAGRRAAHPALGQRARAARRAGRQPAADDGRRRARAARRHGPGRGLEATADADAALAELGWFDMLATEPDDAIAIVFEALGRTNATASAHRRRRRCTHSAWTPARRTRS